MVVFFSLRQRHLELDLFELLGRVAYLAQERQPAWIVAQADEGGVRGDRAQIWLSVLKSFFEPFEAQVGLAAQRSEQPDTVGRRSAVALYRLGEQCVGLGLFAESEVRGRKRVHPELRIALLLRVSHCGLR